MTTATEQHYRPGSADSDTIPLRVHKLLSNYHDADRKEKKRSKSSIRELTADDSDKSIYEAIDKLCQELNKPFSVEITDPSLKSDDGCNSDGGESTYSIPTPLGELDRTQMSYPADTQSRTVVDQNPPPTILPAPSQYSLSSYPESEPEAEVVQSSATPGVRINPEAWSSEIASTHVQSRRSVHTSSSTASSVDRPCSNDLADGYSVPYDKVVPGKAPITDSFIASNKELSDGSYRGPASPTSSSSSRLSILSVPSVKKMWRRLRRK